MCCHHDLDAALQQGCQAKDVVSCSGPSTGTVRQLDLTLTQLQGTLSPSVLGALRVLTSYGMNALDISR